ncbi:MAG: hypothetical protein ACPGUV_10400 [Polyangiales bacterium]
MHRSQAILYTTGAILGFLVTLGLSLDGRPVLGMGLATAGFALASVWAAAQSTQR